MATKEIGIILNGATGRICSTQHMHASLIPIRDAGGIQVGGDTIVPKLLLAGRNEERLATTAKQHNVDAWTTDLDAALADPDYPIFFDAAATHLRLATLRKAIEAGKHIYTEKPVAPSVAEGMELLAAAEAKGLKHAAVEDKIYLPGFLKLKQLVDEGFFGRIVSFKLEFGWWVFDGAERESQRPSWNYTKAGGGGLISDMHPHWRYSIEHILGPIRRCVATAWTAQPKRIDEQGQEYDVDVEDSTSALLEMDNGAYGSILSSWATRVRRDDLVTFQIDGTGGTALATLRQCWYQAGPDTPDIHGFNMGRDQDTMDFSRDYFAGWQEVPDPGPYKNPYRYGWEGFIPHVVADAPFGSTLAAGIRDVAFAEACLRSAAEERWLDFDAVSA